MISYEEDWLLPLLFKLEGSVYLRSVTFAFPSAIFAFILLIVERRGETKLLQDAGLLNHDSSVLWTAVTACLIFLVGFRTRQGLSRFWEGTGLLHQMKGEWFDTVSNCVTFTIASSKKDPRKKFAVEQFRHTIVRLMSLCHGSALEEISGMSGTLETIDVMGLNSATLKHLKDCVDNHHFNKVEVLLHLVQSLITDAYEAGIITIPPPILSRVYQTISRGYVNLLNTKKITDTKFPFPYVQLITFLLLLHTVMAPIAVTSIIDHLVWAPIFVFVPVFGSHALNFIAIELEDPFGEDDNDLPLAHFQAEMNNCLLMLLHPNTDIIAGVSDKCILNFEELKGSVNVITHMGDMVSKDHGASKSRRVSINLFDPNFKLMGSSSKSNLEAVVAMIERHRPGSKERATKPKAEESSECDDPYRENTESSITIESSPLDAQGIQVFNTDEHLIAGQGPGGRFLFPEPKLLQSKEHEALLVKSMEDFNSSLQSWTQKMDEQVREIVGAFNNIGLAAVAGRDPTIPRLDDDPASAEAGGGLPRSTEAYLAAVAAATRMSPPPPEMTNSSTLDGRLESSILGYAR